jgi:hypothetical protein
MNRTTLRHWIAFLVALHYLALAVGLPFLHRHGEAGPPACTAAHGAALAHGAGSDADHCPSCQWDQIAKAAPPAPLLRSQSERFVTRCQLPRAEDPFFPNLGLPASRAPPIPAL